MAQPGKANTRDIKILSVVWFKVLPPKYGGQKAVALFNEHLSRLCSLICICSANNQIRNVSYPVLNSLPVNKFQFINPLVWKRIYQTAKEEQITHLILEFPYHGIAAIVCRKLLGIKLVVNSHNIEFLRFKQQHKWWWKFLFYYEKWVLANADAVFFKTGNDLQIAGENFGLQQEKLFVIPYGTDQKLDVVAREARKIICQRHSIKENKKILLFAGTLDYLPNAKAVDLIAKELVPRLIQENLDFKVVICGRNYLPQFQYLSSLARNEIIFAGEADDIANYFNAADVFIDPVLMGGGIQTKIIDALSYHRNVVCFRSKGKHIQQAENKIFLADDDDVSGFVNAIQSALIKNDETCPVFFETYNWRSIAAIAYRKLSSL